MTGAIALQKLIAISSESITRVKQVAGPLWKVLSLSLADEAILPKRGLALSIEPAGFSIAYGTRFLSRITIRGTRTYPFEEGRYPSPGNLASTIALARSELKAFRSEITLSIPKAWVVVKTVELPITVKGSLVNVISYELDRLTPFSSDSALYDYRVLSEDKGKLSIILVATKADLIDPYLVALREKGITVDRVTVALSAMATLSNFVHSQESAIFVNISAAGYEGGYALGGALSSVFGGRFDGDSESSNVETIIREINQCADSIKKDGEKPLLILSASEATYASELKKRMTPVVDLLQGIESRLGFSQRGEGISLTAAGSMLESLWPQAKGFNLLQKGRREKTRTPVVFTIILLLALLTIGILYVVAPLRIEEKRLEEIDRRVAAIRPEVKKVEALKKEVDALEAEVSTIDDFKKGKPTALHILKELTTILPKNAWLTRVRVTDTTVEIDGYAAAATELLSKLEASPYLKKVEFASPTFRDVRLNSDRFVIKMEIEGITKQVKEKGKDGESGITGGK